MGHERNASRSGTIVACAELLSCLVPHAPCRSHFMYEATSAAKSASLLDALAELVAREARHDVGGTVLLRLLGHVLRDRRLVVADVRLLEEACLAVELLHLAGHHLLDDVLRLARLERLLLGDLALGVEVLLRHVLAAKKARLGGGDV